MITCWISVEDKLPQVDEVYHEWYRSCDVLVYRECGTICVAYAFAEEDAKDVGWRSFDSEGWYLDDVSHWMPLPEPPQGD